MNRAKHFQDLSKSKPEDLVEVHVKDMTDIALAWAMAAFTGKLENTIGFPSGNSCHEVELDPETLKFINMRDGTPWNAYTVLGKVVNIDDVTIGPWHDGKFSSHMGIEPDDYHPRFISHIRVIAIAKAVVADRLGVLVKIPSIFVR